jgi:hypothetical protein
MVPLHECHSWGLPRNLNSPGCPLTPALFPSAGARETRERTLRFEGTMRERSVRGVLTPFALLALTSGGRPGRLGPSADQLKHYTAML